MRCYGFLIRHTTMLTVILRIKSSTFHISVGEYGEVESIERMEAERRFLFLQKMMRRIPAPYFL